MGGWGGVLGKPKQRQLSWKPPKSGLVPKQLRFHPREIWGTFEMTISLRRSTRGFADWVVGSNGHALRFYDPAWVASTSISLKSTGIDLSQLSHTFKMRPNHIHTYLSLLVYLCICIYITAISIYIYYNIYDQRIYIFVSRSAPGTSRWCIQGFTRWCELGFAHQKETQNQHPT